MRGSIPAWMTNFEAKMIFKVKTSFYKTIHHSYTGSDGSVRNYTSSVVDYSVYKIYHRIQDVPSFAEPILDEYDLPYRDETLMFLYENAPNRFYKRNTLASGYKRHWHRGHGQNLMNEKRANLAPDVKPRAKRSNKNLPNSWDYYRHSKGRNWKNFRKEQYHGNAVFEESTKI